MFPFSASTSFISVLKWLTGNHCGAHTGLVWNAFSSSVFLEGPARNKHGALLFIAKATFARVAANSQLK